MNEVAWPLYGKDFAERRFQSAFDSGRLHHGWLIEGPSGVGKSILARRFAAYLLGARGPAAAPFDATMTDGVVQKVIAEGHPDLHWVKRLTDEKGKVKQDISVEQIRGLSKFFSLKPAMGGWRVGVLDALDELNASGANALLKTLEEPPSNCVLFLISHGSRAILPTIRSRCRTLRVSRLSDEDTARALGPDTPKAVIDLSQGRPGLGLRLSSPAGIASADAARAMLRSLPKPSAALVSAAIESLTHQVLDWLQAKADSDASSAATWIEVARIASEANALSMDPTQSSAKLVATLLAGQRVG